MDALYAQEPRALMSDYISFSDNSKKDVCSKYLSYEDACDWGIYKHYLQKRKVFFSAFPGYDTTPRHGKRGIIFDGATPEKFEESFRKIFEKSIQHGNEFVFINAWNEWGEGNYLEPDIKYGYGFLEAVKKVVLEEREQSFIAENCIPQAVNQVIQERELQGDKFKSYFKLFDSWMTLIDEEKSIVSFFKRGNYRSIGIYGFGVMGRHLLKQLGNEVEVKYFIDQRINIPDFSIPVLGINEKLPFVDIIVVTPIYDYENILESLKKRTDMAVVSLKTVIMESL